MRLHFALILFSLLAELRSASAAEKPKCHFAELDLFSGYLESLVYSLPVPHLCYGDTGAAEFRKLFIQAIIDYGVSQMCDVYDQAKCRSNDLIANITKDYEELKELIESIDEYNDDPICLDDALKKLTSQVQIFLDLKPGHQKIDSPVLPPVPEQQIHVKNRTTEFSLNETFIDLESTIDHLGSQIYGYFNSIILSGWPVMRPHFKIFRLKFYNDFLNHRVLEAYREIVEKVCDDDRVIRKHVSTKTWKKFKTVKDRVIEISDECRGSTN